MNEFPSIGVLAGIAALASPFVLIFYGLRVLGPRSTAYRWATGVSLTAAFLIVWVALAVGIIGEPGDLADGMYVGVLAIGGIGALIARFQAGGMSRTLFATALAQALVPAIALITGVQQTSATPVGAFLVMNGILVALFVVSGLLFRSAARGQPPSDAASAA